MHKIDKLIKLARKKGRFFLTPEEQLAVEKFLKRERKEKDLEKYEKIPYFR